MKNITLYNFEKFIDERIVSRGKSYFENGVISEIEKVGEDEYLATVFGTEAYSVNIVLTKNDEIFTHNCDCPYDWGVVCKHKVAVLFFIRVAKENGMPIGEGNISKIKNELKNYKKNELAQLIVNLAKANSKTKNEILEALGFEYDEEDF